MNRRPSSDFEIDLVPCIGLLSILTTFLVATAVWNQLFTLSLDQEVASAPAVPTVDPAPPLLLRIGTGGAAIGRGHADRALPLVEEAHDWPAIATALAEERAGSDGQLVLVVEDGVPYEDAIRGLDLAKETGFEHTRLGSP